MDKIESLDQIRSFETELGSVYTRLPDGKYQRRKFTGVLKEPYEVNVFFPDFEKIMQVSSGKLKGICGNTQEEYEDGLAHFVYRSDHKFVIIDRKGNRVESTDQAVNSKDGMFAALISPTNPNVPYVYIPVSKFPRLGYIPYEVSKAFQVGDEWKKKVHLGHRISRVNLVDGGFYE